MGFPAAAPNVSDQQAIANQDNNRTLRFKFFPAADPANSPLLVLFHGWSGQPYDFAHPEWNILAPWDCFGVARNGCWWLGEDGNYFMLPLLDNAINAVMQKHGIKREIYCWGTSMGGFGALFHGLRWKAKAICANVPQISIMGNEYYSYNAKLVDKVFGADRNTPLSDVSNLLDKENPTNNPMIFLVQSRFDMYERYTCEQCFHFIDVMNQHNINYFLSILPVKGHLILAPPDQALNLFRQYQSTINKPLTF